MKKDSLQIYKPAQSVSIYRADCLDFLKSLPDESVDIIVTDPAYSGMNNRLNLGRGRIVGHYQNKKSNHKWFPEFRDDPETFLHFLKECKRVLKDDRHIYKEGKPLSTAPGGVPDGMGRYQDFVLTIEVTLARGERQFETENESVPRHLGKIVKSLRESSDARPVFGFFIASGLNMSTVAHFYALRRSSILHYGGKAKIIPLDLTAFKHMLAIARDTGGIKAAQLFAFLTWADEEADRVGNEKEWYLAIERKVPDWTKC